MALRGHPMYGRMTPDRNPEQLIYMSNMLHKFSQDYERRRRDDTQTTPEEESKVLTVLQTEFYVDRNAVDHNTSDFEVVQDNPKTPVFRRGQDFFMAIRFDGEPNFDRDIVRLAFAFGPQPAVHKGTRAIIKVNQNPEIDEKKWDARVHGIAGNVVTLQINIPVYSPVGLWYLSIQTSSIGTTAFKDFKCKEDIYILFNPWVKEDPVYMEDDAQRKEYILNDTGKIWMGSFLAPQGRRWFFGQFDDVVLPAAVHLLEKSGLRHEDRGNPVLMARAISAIINSEDEDGLIEGNWSADFTGGTSPFVWTGSVAIMEKYLQRGGRSVQFGQCWVFSGTAVTICRALGIPSRPVTCYSSAHDTNNSLTLDKYFKRDGTEIEGGPDGNCYDSCWNFHVWVDVWMKRTDLPDQMSGWQVIDPTPQEESDGMYRCGPASLEAIRRGEVGYLYDTKFTFAAVNSDVLHFQEDRESTWGFSRLNFDECHVGKKLVTKKVGVDDDDENSCNDMEDVTYLYKSPEGSDAERMAVYNAIRSEEQSRRHYDVALAEEEDVVFILEEIETVRFGEPFKIFVKIENKSDQKRTIKATMAAHSVFYTGHTAHVLKKAAGKIVLEPKQSENMFISVSAEQYLEKTVDHNMIKIYAIANVKETKQNWSKEDDFPLLKPSLTVSISGNLKVGSECVAAFTFTNPINRLLTSCVISVEGPGLQRPKTQDFRDVQPYETVTFTEAFVPKRGGSRKIMASFNSKLLTGVNGSTTVEVQE